VWRPGEADVSIRPGWFYHPAEDARVRSAEDLVNLYFASVGRNSKLLLNVPPTRDGLLHETDITRLREMRDRLTTMFAQRITHATAPSWRLASERTGVAEIDLGRLTGVVISDLREDITRGQRVSAFTVEGAADAGWQVLARGTTIGYRRLDRVARTPVRRVRVTVQTITAPHPIEVVLHAGG
jgi:alpha-L-fucosidase